MILSYTMGFFPTGRIVASPQSVPSSIASHDGASGPKEAAVNANVARKSNTPILLCVGVCFGDVLRQGRKK